MIDALTCSFASLERQKSDLLHSLSAWPREHLDWHPGEGCWSATEVIDHLARVEDGIVEQTLAALPETHRIGFKDRAGVFLLNSLFRFPARVKVPRSVSAILPGMEADFDTVTAEWTQTRLRLCRMLDALAPSAMKGGVFQHPVGGWMTIPQVLSFFSVHLIHHEFQIARIQKALRSQGRAAAA